MKLHKGELKNFVQESYHRYLHKPSESSSYQIYLHKPSESPEGRLDREFIAVCANQACFDFPTLKQYHGDRCREISEEFDSQIASMMERYRNYREFDSHTIALQVVSLKREKRSRLEPMQKSLEKILKQEQWLNEHYTVPKFRYLLKEAITEVKDFLQNDLDLPKSIVEIMAGMVWIDGCAAYEKRKREDSKYPNPKRAFS